MTSAFTEMDIPNDWYCPITCDIMKDPVIGPDGHTYERFAIEHWLSTNDKSPITRKPMQSTNLIPNFALRNTIEAFLKSNLHIVKTQAPQNQSVLDFSQDKITLTCNTKILDNGNTLLNISAISPVYPTCKTRQPCTIICVVDVSGSMDSPVEINTGESQESHGFSRLDLVKHSLKTIIGCMNENDNLAIVTFSDTAKIFMDITQMNNIGKQSSNVFVDSIHTEGMTNIWDGLRVALDLSQSPLCQNTNTVISFLTDGEPNINPPRGILEALKKKIRDNNQFLNVSLSTFGFGYSLDSKLLSDIATECNGIYGYFPDCTFVGTIFVNYLSNVLSFASTRNKLQIQLGSNTKIINHFTQPLIEITPNSKYVMDIGPIQYGQKRDIVLEISGNTIDFTLESNTGAFQFSLTGNKYGSEHEAFVQYYRQKFIDSIKMAMNSFNLTNRMSDSLDIIQDFYREVTLSTVSNDGRILAILKDIKSIDESEGQIGKAFSRQDWYNKWGKHYLPSVCKAHAFQQCLNFKDPGMQNYGGKLFSEIQEKGDDIFCSIPAPTPSCKPHSYTASSYLGRGQNVTPVQTVSNMSSYYDSSGTTCFDGESTVELQNGDIIKVKNMIPGQLVKGFNDEYVKLQCILRTKVEKEIQLCEINSMLITPWHPVFHNGRWMFPIDICKPTMKYVDYVYNVVLENGISLLVNNINCAGLGHNVINDPVLQHPYYGTSRVINDMKKMTGWDKGYIDLENYTLERDQQGYVSKIC